MFRRVADLGPHIRISLDWRSNCPYMVWFLLKYSPDVRSSNLPIAIRENTKILNPKSQDSFPAAAQHRLLALGVAPCDQPGKVVFVMGSFATPMPVLTPPPQFLMKLILVFTPALGETLGH